VSATPGCQDPPTQVHINSPADGRKIVTLHADNDGSVSYLIKPALRLRPGPHVAKLVSMPITTTNAFTSS
jgi:hypothetical protein